jgi:hypothetical protein
MYARIIKLDRRNRRFPIYKYAMDFRGVVFKHQHRWQYMDAFQRLYGDDLTVTGEGIDRRVNYNENWLTDSGKDRIYFNNLADVSVVELLRLEPGRRKCDRIT